MTAVVYMTLQELKNNIRAIAVSHKQIADFYYGEDFLLSTGKGKDYPMVYLEIPYSLSYDLDNNRFKDVQFALMVLMAPTNDDVDRDHSNISTAEIIADSLVTRIQNEFAQDGFLVQSVSGLSLREFSDDNVSGFRMEITGRLFRSFCNNNYQDEFNG